MADTDFTENGDQFQQESNNFESSEKMDSNALEPMDDNGSENPGDKINASKNDDDESLICRKIFVGGLSWETTVKDMREYFSKFGEVVDCTLKTDANTGRSRGFGFVLFGAPGDVDKVVNEKTHMLHGRNIDPKRAKARGGREPIKKVFVGGLDPETPEDTIREHFGKFGKIEEIDLPYDKMKGQRRAFCFITFESEAIVDNCCTEAKQKISGKDVDVKKATPKDQQGRFEFGARGRGFGGPQRGRGRGNYNQGWGNQGNYDYNSYGGYGGYGAYDYNYGNYYGNSYQGYDYNNPGWGNYNQGYGSGYNQGYGNNYGGPQTSTYGKTKPRGGGGQNYHPYSR